MERSGSRHHGIEFRISKAEWFDGGRHGRQALNVRGWVSVCRLSTRRRLAVCPRCGAFLRPDPSAKSIQPHVGVFDALGVLRAVLDQVLGELVRAEVERLESLVEDEALAVLGLRYNLP